MFSEPEDETLSSENLSEDYEQTDCAFIDDLRVCLIADTVLALPQDPLPGKLNCVAWSEALQCTFVALQSIIYTIIRSNDLNTNIRKDRNDLNTFYSGNSMINSLRIYLDHWLMACCEDGQGLLWCIPDALSLNSCSRNAPLRMAVSRLPCWSQAAFDPAHFVFGANDHQIHLIDLSEDKPIIDGESAELGQVVGKHQDNVPGVAIYTQNSDQSLMIASTSIDKTLIVWQQRKLAAEKSFTLQAEAGLSDWGWAVEWLERDNLAHPRFVNDVCMPKYKAEKVQKRRMLIMAEHIASIRSAVMQNQDENEEDRDEEEMHGVYVFDGEDVPAAYSIPDENELDREEEDLSILDEILVPHGQPYIAPVTWEDPIPSTTQGNIENLTDEDSDNYDSSEEDPEKQQTLGELLKRCPLLIMACDVRSISIYGYEQVNQVNQDNQHSDMLHVLLRIESPLSEADPDVWLHFRQDSSTAFYSDRFNMIERIGRDLFAVANQGGYVVLLKLVVDEKGEVGAGRLVLPLSKKQLVKQAWIVGMHADERRRTLVVYFSNGRMQTWLFWPRPRSTSIF